MWLRVEPTLDVVQLFRLLEIAHETQVYGVRTRALDLFDRAVAPPVIVTPKSES